MIHSIFVTGAIKYKRRVLASSDLKTLLLDKIEDYFQKYNWELHHWVILDNHYHVLGKSRRGEDLSKIFKGIHGSTAHQIHQATNCEKPIWWNYWDYCPRNERQYFVRLNYLLFNPIHHGCVTDLNDYPFSSFHKLFSEIGRDKLIEQFQEHSNYKTLNLEDDDF